MSETEYKNTGIGFVGLLTLIFVVAKIWNKIDWSWWIVFSPIWISFGIALLIISILLIIVFIQEVRG